MSVPKCKKLDDMMAQMLMEAHSGQRYVQAQLDNGYIQYQPCQPQQPQPHLIDGPLITIYIKDWSGTIITLTVPDNATIHHVIQRIKQSHGMHDDLNDIRLFINPPDSDGTNPIILDGQLDTCVPGGIQDGDTIEMLEVETEFTGMYGMGKRRSKKSAKKNRSKKKSAKKTKKSVKKNRSKKKSAKKTKKSVKKNRA